MQDEVISQSDKTTAPPVIKRRKASQKRWIVLAVLTLLIFAGGTGFYVYDRPKGNQTSINQYTRQVDFPLYYPTILPKGYVEKAGSTKISSGIVFFTLTNDAEDVVLSEQAAPKTPPDFKKLQDTLSFKNIDVETGQAVIGQNLGLPTALLLTNTTLITLNATKNIPSDVLIDIIKSLHSIQ